ncbi:sulfurtransferase TusA family protein [Calderihabitans maritimus]|uniref:Response regulator SirA n=1 Tax=Calderihabitans maritimus TaxID=1246530 RepID=A0A1Z5HR85_9FIRM|nr:sulfurtransferase TusA family protein [Calderihabitans maritimus]GAW92024.1 response regulator SirA [Calderihabitans maritimus]
MATHRLDVLGEVCPVPLLKTQQICRRLKTGDTLVVETNFSRSVRNILDWAEKNRYEFTVESTENGIWQIFLTKQE